MKRNAIARLAIYCILAAVLTGILVDSLDLGDFEWELGEDGTAVTGTASIDATPIQRIRIEWVDGTVDIATADQDTITFSETNGEKQCMVYQIKGDTLVIRYSKESIQLGLHVTTPNKQLTVYVPQDWMAEDIEISAVSAIITVDLPEVQETKIENVSGDTIVRYVRSQEVSFSTVSGFVSFEGICEELDCSSVSGNCKVTLLGRAKQISMESVSGDLDISFANQYGFTAKLESVSGRISSTFPTSVSGRTHTYGDGRMQIEAETVSGSIHIYEA